jgi:hypothetical protein
MATLKNPPSPDYGTEVDDGARVDTPAPNARQAVTGQNVRYVLAASLAGVILLFALVYFLFF